MVKFNLIKRTQQSDESGIVSLIIVAVLAVVMGLVAVGFAKITDRELTQASDRELSAQAFYAAEAGINDARAFLQACDPADNPPGSCDFSGCTNWPALGDQYFVDKLDTSGTAKYTCVSVNTEPADLSYPLNAGQSKTVKINTSNIGGMTKLFFGWENQGYDNTGTPLGNLGELPQESDPIIKNNPSTTGVLRVDIYPVAQGATSVSNDTLANASRTYYLYPNDGSGVNGNPGSIVYGGGSYNSAATGGGVGGNNGAFVPGNCKVGNKNPVNGSQASPSYCNSIVAGLSGLTNAYYYVRLTAMYTPQTVSIAATDNGNNSLPINSTQGVIDVTGKGTDVLQRIRARVDLSNQFLGANYGLQSMEAICKGFTLDVTGIGQYGNNADTSQMPPSSDGACATPNGGGSVGSTAGDLGSH